MYQFCNTKQKKNKLVGRVGMTVIWGIRKIHRPHRPQTQYTDLLFSNYFLALGKYTDLLGKCTDPINRQINKTHDYSNSGSFSD